MLYSPTVQEDEILPPAIADGDGLVLDQIDPNFDCLEVSLWLRVSERELGKMRDAGTGPHFILVNGRVRYALSDLLKWRKDNRHQIHDGSRPFRARRRTVKAAA